MTSSWLIASAAALFPNKVTFRGPGVGTSTYELEAGQEDHSSTHNKEGTAEQLRKGQEWLGACHPFSKWSTDT